MPHLCVGGGAVCGDEGLVVVLLFVVVAISALADATLTAGSKPTPHRQIATSRVLVREAMMPYPACK